MNSKEFIVAAIIFVFVGAMVMDPLAELFFFALSGILTLFAALKGAKLQRYIAFLVLIIISFLIISIFPEARHHFHLYRAGH